MTIMKNIIIFFLFLLPLLASSQHVETRFYAKLVLEDSTYVVEKQFRMNYYMDVEGKNLWKRGKFYRKFLSREEVGDVIALRTYYWSGTYPAIFVKLGTMPYVANSDIVVEPTYRGQILRVYYNWPWQLDIVKNKTKDGILHI